jgi:hypothetical protein
MDCKNEKLSKKFKIEQKKKCMNDVVMYYQISCLTHQFIDANHLPLRLFLFSNTITLSEQRLMK